MAVDAAGNRLVWDGDVEAFDTDGGIVSSHATDVLSTYDLHDNVLAIDSTGAILLAGAEHIDGPIRLVKLLVEEPGG